MQATRHIYLTADRTRVVLEGDPAGAFLYAAPGDEIPDEAAKRLRIGPDGLPLDGDVTVEMLRDLWPVVAAGTADSFTADGRPKVAAIERLLGQRVPAQMVSEAWEAWVAEQKQSDPDWQVPALKQGGKAEDKQGGRGQNKGATAPAGGKD